MKQMKLILSIAMIAMIGMFTACEDDETAEINIGTVDYPETIEVGETVTITTNIVSDEKLEEIILRKGTEDIDTVEDFSDNYSHAYNYTGVLANTEDAGKTLELALIATDKKDNQKTSNFEITVKESGDSINTYSDVTIGSISRNTTDKTYYDAINNTLYFHDDADAYKSDFGYIYGSNNGATVCSPDWSSIESLNQGTGSWNSKKATRFITTELTANDFDAIGADVDADLVIENNVSAPSDEYVNHLEVGGTNENVEVIGFETEEGNKGLIKIKSIDEGSSADYPNESGTITIDVKIQK